MDKESIKLLRRITGMSQLEFARSIGVNYHSLTNFEAGRLVDTFDIEHQVIEKYGLSNIERLQRLAETMRGMCL